MDTNKGKYINKYICIISLFIIVFIALHCYKEYASYKSTQEMHIKSINILNDNKNLIIESIINDNINHFNYIINDLSVNIEKDLLNHYKNNDEKFIKDINYPTKNSELTKILSSNIDKLNIEEKDHIFVASMDKILYTKNGSFHNSNKEYITWDEVQNTQYNKKLAKLAIDTIRNLDNNNNYIFWEPINYNNKNHSKISDMDINSLLDIYDKEGIEIFKNYELLIPSYITETGDILNNKDYNNFGKKEITYKIIILQRINLYDIIKDHIDNINKINLEIKNIEFIIDSELHYTASLTIQSILFIFIILIGSWYMQKKITNKYK